MAVRAIKDTYGTSYAIPKAKDGVTPGGKSFQGTPEISVWWDRDHTRKADETLILRQENSADRSDVITLTLAQAYDLLHAVGLAVMRP